MFSEIKGLKFRCTLITLFSSLNWIWVFTCALGAYSSAGWTLDAALNTKPKGIFISGGHQVTSVLAQEFVDGALIRVRWSALEPSPGLYDWDDLDDEIAKVKAAGKKYTLAIVSGPRAPKWLYNELKAPSYNYSFKRPSTNKNSANKNSTNKNRSKNKILPLPWDEVYLTRWLQIVDAAGKRYRDDPDLYLVHITSSSQNGFEMQLPMKRGSRDSNEVPDWKDYGFSKDRYMAAVKRVIDAFAEAFPTQFLDLEIHSVLTDSSIPEELIDYGASTLGHRFGPFGAWLNNRDTHWDKPLRAVMAKHGKTSFCNYQLIGNVTRQAKKVGPGGLQGAVDLGVSQGCLYYEIWEVDLKNIELRAWLSDTHRQLNAKPLK